MGNKQINNNEIVETIPSSINHYFFALTKSKANLHFLCRFETTEDYYLGKPNKDLENSIQRELEGSPLKFRLGWNEEFIYLILNQKNEFKFAIFESKSLRLKKIISDIPSTCDNFVFISPKYNEYFKMKLYLFEKTYRKILINLDQGYDLFKKHNKGKKVIYKSVVLTSYHPK